MGGPHMGVDAVPQCTSGPICDVVNFVVKHLINFSIVQDLVAPAGYFRDINNYQNYLKYSVFLPAMNSEFNQSDDYANLRKKRFEALNYAYFGMFSEDSVIYPKETAWFQSVDTKGQ